MEIIKNIMKNILEESTQIESFTKNYFEYLNSLLQELDMKEIIKFVNIIEKARKADNTIFFIGNGGSAATASHMANDLGANIYANDGESLPLRALALTDNSPLMLAIANDNGYDNLFIDQLKIHYRKGDKLVAISASGNSKNVILAAEYVKKQGGEVVSLVGFDGGTLGKISDVVIHAKTNKGEYGPVEDVHMIMDHLIVTWLQHKNLKEMS